MKEKEFEIQKALGLAAEYNVYPVVDIPITIMTHLPLVIKVAATSKADAKRRVIAMFKKMTPQERLKFVFDQLEEGNCIYRDYNSPEVDVQLNEAKKADIKVFEKMKLNINIHEVEHQHS